MDEIELKLDSARPGAEEPPAPVLFGGATTEPERQLLAPSKAGRVPVRSGMTVAQGFAAIVDSCVSHYRMNEPLVIEARHAEAFHQLRVALRRMRCAFSLFRPAIRDREFAHIRDELRWFAEELGDARNLDVYLQRDIDPVERPAIEVKREFAYDRALDAMNSDRQRRLMADLVHWTVAGDWRRTRKAGRRLELFMNRRIDGLWSKIAASRRLRRMSDEGRHQLRIRVKKLRYGLEFTGTLHGRERKRRKRFGRALRRLQEALGLLNDIVVARSLGPTGSWLVDPQAFEADERDHVREARSALRRVRKMRPYWDS